jgi:hypothetical protein
MEASNTPVSIEMLRVEERGHRRRVDHDPMDTCSRMNLAWCLFVQAMHQAGGENALANLQETGAVSECRRGASIRLDCDAEHLLRECLRQMSAVCELSRDPGDMADVERLRYLVVVSGAEAAMREADEEAARLLAGMGRAVVSAPVVERSNHRRRAPRRMS